MKYRVTVSPEARRDFHSLATYDRSRVRDFIDTYLIHDPTAESKSRIKRLRDMKKPQYRLRIDDLRVFYDVEGDEIVLLGMTTKAHAEQWLKERGERT